MKEGGGLIKSVPAQKLARLDKEEPEPVLGNNFTLKPVGCPDKDHLVFRAQGTEFLGDSDAGEHMSSCSTGSYKELHGRSFSALSMIPTSGVSMSSAATG